MRERGGTGDWGEKEKERQRELFFPSNGLSWKGIHYYKEFFHGLKIYNEIEKYTLKSDANDVKKMVNDGTFAGSDSVWSNEL